MDHAPAFDSGSEKTPLRESRDVMKHANRLSNMPSYPFARWARHVEVARQNPPPDEVIQALGRSAHRADHHGYPGYLGLPVLRKAIAGYYHQRFGVALNPDTEIVPLLGSKEGIVKLALACLDPGDLVLVPDPGYAPYSMGAMLAGAEIYTFALRPEHGFLPDLGAIPPRIANRAILMWLNYPNNPTGSWCGRGCCGIQLAVQNLEHGRMADWDGGG
jgi:LL-diaminopimelate aminotransferase